MLKMLWKEFFCVGVICLCATTSSQPIYCSNNEQCYNDNYYCEANTHICRPCLSCQDLKRELPNVPTACVKSVADCGACLTGYEINRLSDVNTACVQSVPEGTPQYVWWLISVGVIVFLAVMVGIIVYIWMNPYIFESFKLRGNSQGGTLSTDIRAVTRATAPEAPPPYTPSYNIPYSSVRTTESPCPPQHEAADNGDVNSGEEGPFLKCRLGGRPQDARESSSNQAATVYNIPIYDREELPPSPEAPTVAEVTDNLAAIHEEETMASPWTPEGQGNGDINANVSEASTSGEDSTSLNLPAMLAAAKDTSLVEHPAAKRMRIRPMAENNTKRDNNPSGDSSQDNYSGNQNCQPYNFITQITNVVQINRNS